MSLRGWKEAGMGCSCLIVLPYSGPPGVGRTELKKLLLMNDPQAFIATVPRRLSD